MSQNRSSLNPKPSDYGNQDQAIAVIGTSCRYPGGIKTINDLWLLLNNRTDAISDIPVDRWNVEKFYDPIPGTPGKYYTKKGGFIDAHDLFDPEFFGISPREASHMDPQQRLMLEIAWESFEDAGIKIDTNNPTSCGVFVGISNFDYAKMQRNLWEMETIDLHTSTGVSFSITANRISHALNLSGPSIAIDTACSSSLVALHLACQSINNNECEIALAGGTNLILSPETYVNFCRLSMLSKDGKSKAFDKSADGFVRAEGAGAVILKPLSNAIRDQDFIYAVIRGSGVNQDGATPGITVPNGDAQKDLLKDVLNRADISPAKINYVEAHGTGTAIGDPIEANTIGKVIGAARSPDDPCYLGSVKTNIGHLENASGIAGLQKAILILLHHQIPPNLHFNQPNPAIDFSKLNLTVPTDPISLPQNKPTTVCVNSFGYGGTNALVLLENYTAPQFPHRSVEKNSNKPSVFFLSASNNKSLHNYAQNCYEYLKNGLWDKYDLSMICNYSRLKKTSLNHRVNFLVTSKDELLKKLEKFINTETMYGIHYSSGENIKDKKIVFVFSGQGPQWWKMGRELMQSEPTFKKSILACDNLLKEYSSWSLYKELNRDQVNSKMHLTSIAQPAIFAIQVALSDLWKSWGIKPDAVVGHSVGEVAAAYYAGILTLADALKVIYYRGASMEYSSEMNGEMLAVAIEKDAISSYLERFKGKITIGAINSPKLITLTGDKTEILALKEELLNNRIFCKTLNTNYAFHSFHMEGLKDKLLESISDIKTRKPDCHIYSSVSGKPAKKSDFNPTYWWNNVRKPVLFAETITDLLQKGFTEFLEISPHPVLSYPITESIVQLNRKATVLNSLNKKEPELSTMLNSAAILHNLGYPLDWNKIFPSNCHKIPFPSYPWNNRPFWFQTHRNLEYLKNKSDHPLLGRRIISPALCWEKDLSDGRLLYLEEHMINGSPVFPAAAFVEMGIAASREIFDMQFPVMENIYFHEIFYFKKEGTKIYTIFDNNHSRISFYSGDTDHKNSWTLHASMLVSPKSSEVKSKDRGNLPTLKGTPDYFSKQSCYSFFKEAGLDYGSSFRGIKEIYSIHNESLAAVSISKKNKLVFSEYFYHPAILDACFQAIIGNLKNLSKNIHLPFYIKKIIPYSGFTGPIISHINNFTNSDDTICTSIDLYSENHEKIMEIEGFELKPMGEKKTSHDLDSLNFQYHWIEKNLYSDISGDSPFGRISLKTLTHTLNKHAEIYPEENHSDIFKYNSNNLKKETALKLPQYHTELILMNEVGHYLEEIQQKESLTDTIAQNGYLALLLENFLLSSSHFRIINNAILTAVRQMLSEIKLPRKIKILELNGASGGITSQLVTLFEQYDIDYVFTEESHTFLNKAKNKFSKFSNIQYIQYDIRDDLGNVNLSQNSFDLILVPLGMNMRCNLSEILPSIKKLLRNDGLTLFITKNQSWEFYEKLIDKIRGSGLQPNWDENLLRPDFKEIYQIFSGGGETNNQLFNLFAARTSKRSLTSIYIPEEMSIHKFWIIFDTRKNHASQLFSLIQKNNHTIFFITPGKRYKQIDDFSYTIRPGSYSDLQSVFAKIRVKVKKGSIAGIIHLWAMELKNFEKINNEYLQEAYSISIYSLLNLSRYLTSINSIDRPRLWVTTIGAQPVKESLNLINPVHSAIWGMCRTIRNESPAFHISCIDLQIPGKGHKMVASDFPDLSHEIVHNSPEVEIAYRDKTRYVHRFGLKTPSFAKPLLPKNKNRILSFKLHSSNPGSLNNLCFQKMKRRYLKNDQVEIKVYSAGLNFSDVLKALNMYPGLPKGAVPLGIDCSGIVSGVGRNVTEFKPGDRVMGLFPDSFSSFAVTKQALLVKIPEYLNFKCASTIPLAFVTAYQSLVVLGNLKEGESILIHSGTGGVGLAAIQIAQSIGAEIYATAGTGEKREYLHNLGIKYVFDSHSVDFAHKILKITNEEGIDMVLNSLSGLAIPKGLSVLKGNGRFIEIGKTDIYKNTSIGLSGFRKNISFFVLDIDRMLKEKPLLIKEALHNGIKLINRKKFKPIPYTLFPISMYESGFRLMSQAKHIGKIIFDMTSSVVNVKKELNIPYKADPNKTYLITGGFGGIGLIILQWLVSSGARNIVIFSRSGPRSKSAYKILEQNKSKNINIHSFPGDISIESDVDKLIKYIDQKMPPLRGIFHAAMVLKDSSILKMTKNKMEKVFAPKITGTLNLHRKTKDHKLEFFVLFSSVSSLIGMPGQGNYAAANAFLDGFSHYRDSLGLPSSTINWGFVGEAGVAARSRKITTQFKRLGIGALNQKMVLDTLDHILKTPEICRTILKMDWTKFSSGFKSLAINPIFKELIDDFDNHEFEHISTQKMILLENLNNSEKEQINNILNKEIQNQVARILGTGSNMINLDESLLNLGFDSLMGVELRNWIEEQLKIVLPASDIMKGPSINELVENIVKNYFIPTENDTQK